VVTYTLPGLVNQLVFAPVIGAAQPYRFLTTAFLHANFLHIAFNMYALWIVGAYLEQMLGRWRYLLLFLVSAVGGSVAVLLLAAPDASSWFTPVVGASGAVFGAFGAILMVLRRTGRDASQIVVLIAINLVLGFVVPGISWQAHLGGLVTGLVLGRLYASTRARRRAPLALVGTAAAAAVLVVAALLRYLRAGA
jgi:membrane associated rhomboid family serine protease